MFAEKQMLNNESHVPGVMTFKGLLAIMSMDATRGTRGTAVDSLEISSKIMSYPKFRLFFPFFVFNYFLVRTQSSQFGDSTLQHITKTIKLPCVLLYIHIFVHSH